MTLHATALVVDAADGTSSGVMQALDAIGYQVIWVPSLPSALEFLRAQPKVALLVASSNVTQTGALDFLTSVHRLAPTTHLIWGVRHGAASEASALAAERRPDCILSEPFRPAQLRLVAQELLTERIYPPELVETLTRSAVDVLGGLGAFKVAESAHLSAGHSTLCDVTAVMPFAGGACGHLMLGMAAAGARRLLSTGRISEAEGCIDREGDVVGELCNQILGRINVFYLKRGLTIRHGTPISIRAGLSARLGSLHAKSSLRYAGRQPSLLLNLMDGPVQVTAEYCLSEFDLTRIKPPSKERIMPLHEVTLL